MEDSNRDNNLDILDMPYNYITEVAEEHGENIEEIAKALNVSIQKIRYILYYNYNTRKPKLKEKYRNIALAIHKGRYYYNIKKTMQQ